ncbi:MAG: Ig-like domain-containing protein, partial [Ferruginibacter sp.]
MKKKLFFYDATRLQKFSFTNSILKISLAFILPLLLITGCKKVLEEPGLTGICPIVISTVPTNGATGVALNTSISATFNEAIDSTTLNSGTFFVKQGNTNVAGSIIYSGMTAIFTPAANLLPNTVYTGTVTKGIRDKARNSPKANYVWTFTTGVAPDTIPPRVIATDPNNSDTNVLVTKVISAIFSKVMNPATINATTFTLRIGTTPVTGVVTYTGSNASFTPITSLSYNTTYIATITTGARDMAGNALVNNYTWSFTTGLAPADVIPPTVISTDPANASIGVVISKVISANFSEAMNPTTINTSTFSLSQGTTLIAGTVTYSGTTASFTPTALLIPNTVYTATITTGAKDLAGNGLVSNYVFSFTTGLSNADVTPPIVVSTDPPTAATGVILSKIIAATFSEAMNPATINSSTFLLSQGITPVAGTVSYSGTTARFTPT